MAYPPAYDRAYSFTDYEVNFPGEPKPGDKLDTEFDAVSNALTATQTNLALIQRADGQIANNIIGEDQLQDGLLHGIVDGVTDDAEAAAAAAAASAAAAAGSASAAATSATDAAAQVAIAAGHAASAGVSQGIAQGAASDAADSALEADTSADVAVTAANSVENSVAQAQIHEETAFKWAEYLAGPVMPAPPGWPEAVDDGMFSSKWWALRSRDYNEVHEIDLGTGGTNPGEAFDIWDLTHDLDDPPGLVYATWGTPPRTYVLTDPSDPSDPNSWLDITGADGPPGPLGPAGPPGPPNTLTIGTVTTGLPGSPAAATITGTAPNQTLNMTIPAGADGTGTTLVAPTGTIGLTMVPGAATTAARSDSTPPLSQAIAPTWSARHKFDMGTAADPLQLIGADANDTIYLPMYRGDGTTRRGYLGWVTGASGNLSLVNEEVGSLINLNSPNGYNFLGTGTATFNGTVDLLGPLRATGVDGVAGQVLSTQGAGLPPVWRTSSGGSIELGWNFSTAVGTANPGSQKMSMNSAVYASVTTLVFNALAMTNFDANTILSLLQTGNRIYIQQRNDASKAVVYEVTGPGTNMTGYWTIPVVIIQSRGTLFAANADLNCVFILSVSSTSLANPTALVGLTTVNGSATTGMRSDAAPALDLSINPQWTGVHQFVGQGGYFGLRIVGADPAFLFYDNDAPLNEKLTGIEARSSSTTWQFLDDSAAGVRNIMRATRSGVAVTTLSFGNATDNPTYTFLGGGLTTFNGPITVKDTIFIRGTAVGSPNAAYLAFYDSAGTRMGYVGDASGGNSNIMLGADTAGADINLTPGAGGAIVSSNDGTAARPAYSWTSQTDSGMYRNAGNSDARLVYGGVESFYWNTTNSGTLLPMLFPDGTAAVPSITFRSDQNTGIYRVGPDYFGATVGGQYAGGWVFTANPQMVLIDGALGTPGLAFDADRDTGLFRPGANEMRFICGATGVLNLQTTIVTSMVAHVAPSYTSTSSRSIKRETGSPSRPANILARLRPIMYRLLAGGDSEQLGLIAEEVHEVCPQLSDGKSVAYDRLAILLLAAWQEEHLEAA